MKKKIMAFIIATMMILSFGHTAMASSSDWSIVNGFGTVKNTGTGVTDEGDGSVTVNGYGGLCYLPEVIHEAVAVEFQILAFPSSSHYFNFGLLDTKDVFWNTSGTISKGIMARVSVTADGNTIQATGLNITGAPVQTVDAVKSPIKATGVSHMFTMYRDGGNWVYTLDGEAAEMIPVTSAKLGESSYLSVGAYGSSSMEMMISNVYVDEAVTTAMKDGTYIKELAGDAAFNQVYYDEDGRLVIGETLKNSALSYREPIYAVTEMENQKTDVMVYILAGSAVVTFVLSVLVIVIGIRKNKVSAKREGVELHEEND